MRSLFEIVDLLIHVVRRFHHFGICLVGALADDKVDELLDDAHVGLLDVPLSNVPRPSWPPGAPTTGSPEASVCWKRLLPMLLRPEGFGKVRQLDLAGLLRGSLTRQSVAYGSIRCHCMDSALVGMVIGGSKRLPFGSTT